MGRNLKSSNLIFLHHFIHLEIKYNYSNFLPILTGLVQDLNELHYLFWDSQEAACNISKYLNCVPHCINSKYLSAPHECFTKVTWRKHTYSRLLFSTLIYIEQSFWSYQLFDLGSYNQGVSYKKKERVMYFWRLSKAHCTRQVETEGLVSHFSIAWGHWERPKTLSLRDGGGHIIWTLPDPLILPGPTVLLTHGTLALQAFLLFLKHSRSF